MWRTLCGRFVPKCPTQEAQAAFRRSSQNGLPTAPQRCDCSTAVAEPAIVCWVCPAQVVQRCYALFEGSHYVCKRGCLCHFKVSNPGHVPPHFDACNSCRAAVKDLLNLDGRPILELDANWPLSKLEQFPFVTLAVLSKLQRQRPKPEVLHVSMKLVVHLRESGVVVQLLVSDPPELPTVLDTQCLLGIAVDGEVVRNNGRHEVVLDAQGPPLGVHCSDDALILKVQPKTVRLGFFDNWHLWVCWVCCMKDEGPVRWLGLLHGQVEATEDATEQQQSTKEQEPPRPLNTDLGNVGAQRLLSNALPRLEVHLLNHPASAR
mmetsp:Transcript_95750/g.222023  ORF Transcript_95750/g.222023 Transcript_95750/m.222023 type:complete len:319 (-) Transcript_95750:293-1249(-)